MNLEPPLPIHLLLGKGHLTGESLLTGEKIGKYGTKLSHEF